MHINKYVSRRKYMSNKQTKSLALSLSGGAALGMGHIGFLQILDENNIKVDAIAGTSMGSMIGALYCAGYSGKEIEEIAVKKIHIRQFATDFNALNFLYKGLFSGNKIEKTMNKLLKDKSFEDLDKSFKAVTVDILKSEQFIYDSGSVASGVRASISIPGIFTPIKYEDKVLVDGGLLNNNPIDIAKTFDTDVVVSVDVDLINEEKIEPKNTAQVLYASFITVYKNYKKLSDIKPDLDVVINFTDLSAISFDSKSIKQAISLGREYGLRNIEKIKQLVGITE
jgi:NTE family protein